MLGSWAAAIFVGGPAETVFLYTSKLDILLQLYNAYAYNAADALLEDDAATTADETYDTFPMSIMNLPGGPWSGSKWGTIPK